MGRSGRSDISIDDLAVAVAHWHVKSWGGAEYLVTKLAEAVNSEIVFTLGPPDPDEPNPYGDVSFVDVTPSLDYSSLRRLQRYADRVFEYAQWEDVDWRDFGDPDILVTSGATARAVITPEDTLHVNYCHSPPRWYYDQYHDRKTSLTGKAVRPLLRHLRTRDATVDSRVDQYFVNSPIIDRRLWKYYKRESELLYPPVNIEHYRNDGDGDYFLHLGRLDQEKGVPAIVEAFEGLDEQLVLAGDRGDIDDALFERIRRAQNIDYRGFVSPEEKRDLLAGCTAVIFNGLNEDFGIVVIEANASGKPVVTRNEGFPGVFVSDGVNGFRHDGSPAGIRRIVEHSDFAPIDPSIVDQFSFDTFRNSLRSTLRQEYSRLLERVRQ